jgi:hypothetical protein
MIVNDTSNPAKLFKKYPCSGWEIQKEAGYLLDLPGDTVRAVEQAGFRYWDELTHLKPFGTAPLYCTSNFRRRKMVGLVHSSIVVLLKGDPKAAAAELCTPEGVAEATATAWKPHTGPARANLRSVRTAGMRPRGRFLFHFSSSASTAS